MRRIFLLLIILTPILSFSQNNNPIYTISGKIIDASTLLPLEDATVIFKSIDSNQIKFGGITNQRGHFSIEVEKGTYNASVEFISYQTKILNISSISKNLNIGTIQLELDTEFLEEVEVIGEKRTLDFKSNKLIYNVGKDVSAAGRMAPDILNNIPSISVDPDGNITLRGQDGVTVMINGKISSMSKTEALKSLPAGSIENIEVIANPGAKYKASSLGIINIILKKGQNEGLNASVTTAGGYRDYYGGLLTLNHRSKKVNLFTNASYFHRNPITVANYKNEYFNNGISSSFLNENSEYNSKDNGINSTIGADFYLSDQSTLSTSINYSTIDNNSNTLTFSKFFDAAEIETASNNRTHLGNFNDEIFEFIVDFEHNFKKKGQKLISSVSYEKDVETSKNNVTNTNANFTDETYIEKNTLENTLFNIKFSNPINKTSSFTVGYNGEFGRIPFTYSGTSTNNNIDYSENAHYTFIDYEYYTDKFNFELGLRVEFSESTVDYLNLNTKLQKQFNDLFPSLFLGYSFNDTQNLSLSYNRKIQRPSYRIMQPFGEKISETSSYIGNEKIEPFYIDKLDLSYDFSGEKITLSTSLFFDRYNGLWQYVTYETGEKINGVHKIITTPKNVGKVDIYGVNISTIVKVSKGVNFTGNATLYNFDQSGKFETLNSTNETIIRDYNHANFNGELSFLTQIKIPNVFEFQTNIKHFLISKGPYSTRKAYTYASTAINKDLFNKEASISLTLDDVFKSYKTDRDRFDTNYFSKSIIKNKYRTIILSFTYRFNQSKKDRRIDFEKKEMKPNY